MVGRHFGILCRTSHEWISWCVLAAANPAFSLLVLNGFELSLDVAFLDLDSQLSKFGGQLLIQVFICLLWLKLDDLLLVKVLRM